MKKALDSILDSTPVTRLTEAGRFNETVIGVLVGFDESDAPLVDFSGNALGKALPARSTVVLGDRETGAEVALVFEGGNPARPIVLGVIQPAGKVRRNLAIQERREANGGMDIAIDGERLVFSAQKEIVLRCGNSSIVLTRAGKIVIRGAYLLSRSSGVNLIKGGSVQIN